MVCYKCEKTLEGEPERCPFCDAALPSLPAGIDVSTDALLEAELLRCANALGRNRADTYVKGDPVPKWMNTLKKTVRADIDTDNVLFARNLALLAAGKSGVILTANAFYYKNVGECEKVRFSDVADVLVTSGDSPICVFRAPEGCNETKKTVFVSYITPLLITFVRLYCLRHGLELKNYPAPRGAKGGKKADVVASVRGAVSKPGPEPAPEPDLKPVLRSEPRRETTEKEKPEPNSETVPERKKYVFISYSSKNETVAVKLKNMFQQGGVNTWMAPGDIPPGSNYLESVNRAIKGCACVALLLTEEAQKSKWVYKELERAINADKPIFPVQLGPVALTDAFEFMLSTCQFITVTPDGRVDENERALLDAVRRFTC